MYNYMLPIYPGKSRIHPYPYTNTSSSWRVLMVSMAWFILRIENSSTHRGTSLITNRRRLGPYGRTMPRAL